MSVKNQKGNVADAIVEHLLAMGIRAVFGIPGGAIEPLYDSLARAANAGLLRLVTARNEAGAAYMAFGWWLETGTPAAVVATTGPGAINALAGVACANVERAPMVVLTGQVTSPKQGRNALQESSATSGADTVAMFAACTAFSALVTHPLQLGAMLANAFVRMHQDPLGPVHLSIPTDVLRQPRECSAIDYPTLLSNAQQLPDRHVARQAAKLLQRSRRPVVMLGDASLSAIHEALLLAEALDAPVCGSHMLAGNDHEQHPLFCGRFGFGGHAEAKAAVDRADVALIVDTSGGEFDGFAWGPHAAKSIHLSESAFRLSRIPEAKLHLLGDLQVTLNELALRIRPKKRGRQTVRWQPQLPTLDNAFGVPPQAMMRVLAERLPRGTAVYVDAGNAMAWSIQWLHAKDRSCLLRLAINYGSMGWSVGAVVGAALANKRPTVALVGDGAMLMAGQEFSTAVYERTPCVFIVLNDSALGMVKHGQRLTGAEKGGFELPQTDFAAMARAMGGYGVSVNTLQKLSLIDWSELFAQRGPTVLDVRIDGEQVPPMHDRVRALAAT